MPPRSPGSGSDCESELSEGQGSSSQQGYKHQGFCDSTCGNSCNPEGQGYHHLAYCKGTCGNNCNKEQVVESKQSSERTGGNGKQTAKIHPEPDATDVSTKKEEPELPEPISDRCMIIVCVAVIFIYFTVGVLVYTQEEGWSFLDALYFCVVTLTTVGYGDLLPSSDGSKLFTCGFVIIGIGMIGSALGIVSGYLLDKQEAMLEELAEKTGLDDGDDSNDCLSPAMQELLEGIATTTFFVAAGTTFYTLYEDFSFVDALYLSVITMTTVGYGDMSPQKEGGRAFALVWMLFGVLSVSRAIGQVVNIFMERRQQRKEMMLLNKKVSMQDLLESAGKDGVLDENEFCLMKLQAMGKISQDEIIQIRAVFQEMDKDGTGSIDAKDIA